MEGTFHALGLLALPAMTVVFCVFSKRRKVDSRVLLDSGLVSVVTFFLIGSLFTDFGLSGAPLTQVAIGSLSLGLCLLCIDRRRVRIPLALFIVACTFALAYHYEKLVLQPDWTGPQVRQAALAARLQGNLNFIQEELSTNAKKDNTVYPAGWVRDLPFRECFDEAFIRSDDIFRVNIGRAWHSFFTRLFPVERIPQDFWYPGGTIAQAVDSMEIRDRP